MGQSLHHILEDFSGANPVGPRISQDLELSRLQPRMVAVSEAAAQSERALRDAFAKGVEEGQAVARAQHDVALELQRADYEHQFESTRTAFSQTVAADLATNLCNSMEQLYSLLAGQILSAFLPVLRNAVAEAAVRDLADGIKLLVEDKTAVCVELTGPQDVIDRVWTRYCELAATPPAAPTATVEFIHSDAIEVRVRVDDAVIESRLLEWSTKIAEAVG